MFTDDSRDEQVIRNYEKIKSCWLNERTSPEILPFETSTVESFQKEIQELEESIENSQPLSDKQFGVSEKQKFVNNILLMSLDRSKYILSSYLRCRLRKIEKYYNYYLREESLRAKLSEGEIDFATKYKSLVDNLFQTALLDNLPSEYQQFDETMIAKPNLDTHIICRVLETIGELEIDATTGVSVEFTEGDILAIRYRTIRQLLLDKRVELC